jgi:hypothetical protein
MIQNAFAAQPKSIAASDALYGAISFYGLSRFKWHSGRASA